MRVPLCGGVPAASRTCAMIGVLPLTGSTLVEAVSVIDDPDGASSGTFSHAVRVSDRAATTAPKAVNFRLRVIIEALNILNP